MITGKVDIRTAGNMGHISILEQGRVVASVEYYDGVSAINLHMISVSPEYRRQGYAEELLMKLIELSEDYNKELIAPQLTEDGRSFLYGLESKGVVQVIEYHDVTSYYEIRRAHSAPTEGVPV